MVIAAEAVRKVDISAAPGMRSMAEHARELANEIYPQILALLGQPISRVPLQFDIVFKQQLESGNVGQSRLEEIQLSAAWLAMNPAALDSVLVHEVTHVAQQYGAKVPFYWTEGIADYLCYRLGFTNEWNCPQCTANYPHYTSGYTCAGAFLLFIADSYGSNVICQLNRQLTRGSFSPKLFRDLTGKNLDALWVDFQKTPAFLTSAGEINELRELLGFKDGQPPKDIATRLKTSPGGTLCVEAGEYLKTVIDGQGLPGLAKAEHGTLTATIDPMELLKQTRSRGFPFSCQIDCRKNDDPALYHYIVTRASESATWKLEKAWRTSPDRRMIENYLGQ